MLEFEGTIAKVIWRPADDRGYPTVAILAVVPVDETKAGEQGTVSVKARIEDEEDDDLIRVHASLRFYGHWGKYRDENQFDAKTFVRMTPHTRSAIITYLQEAPGIGGVIAPRIFREFSFDSVRVLRCNPELVAKKVKGLSGVKAFEASAWLTENKHMEDCRIELDDLLGGHGFPRGVYKKAIREWGNRAAAVIRQNPFALMQFRGCGFKRTDALYIALGKPPKSLKRQALCAWYEIANGSHSDGSTWIYRTQAERVLRGSIGGAEVRVEKAFELALRARLLANRKTASDQATFDWDGPLEWLADGRKAANELRLAHFIAEAVGEKDAAVPRDNRPNDYVPGVLPVAASLGNTPPPGLAAGAVDQSDMDSDAPWE